MRTALVMVGVLLLVGCKPTSNTESAEAKIDHAKMTVKKYAFEAYPQWAMAHVDKACPDKVDDLDQYMSTKDHNDPWGHPYKLMCGATLPPDAKGVGILSNGPDGAEGTSDDIKSWN